MAFITREELERQLAEACGGLAKLRGQVASRGEAADAVRAVLIGRPNTGKSSLLNALAGDRAALVSDHPGTTRDYLTADVELDGVQCRLVDTAGTSGEAEGAEDDGAAARRALGQLPVEQAAQAVAAEQCRAAHVQVLCLDATRPLDAWERGELAHGRGPADHRADEVRCAARDRLPPRRLGDQQHYGTRNGRIARGVAAASARPDGEPGRRGGRHGLASLPIRSGWPTSVSAPRGKWPRPAQELAATEIRLALEELGKVAGAVYTDDVLERIFSRFCIGK